MNLNPVGWASSSLRLVARLFNSGVNSTVPVTAISEAPIGLTNADIALVAKGTGATLAQVPDGTASGGDKRGIYATDLQKTRLSADQVASGPNSFIGGGDRNKATGSNSGICAGVLNSVTQQHSAILGGSTNTVSGQTAVVVGGSSNTASSNNSFVGGGQSNIAQTNTHATVCGGNSNTASGQYSFVGGGSGNTASDILANVFGGASNISSAAHATIAGGRGGVANSTYSFIAGSNKGTTRSIIGYTVFPASNVPIADVSGVTQSALLLLGRETTTATATVLTSNGSAASTTNQVILPNNSAYSFSGEVIAGVTGGGDTARWTINGAIKRGANAASTTMVGTATVTMTHNDAGAAAWVVAVTADTTNGGIAVTVTGAAATTIRWVCRVFTTEMTY